MCCDLIVKGGSVFTINLSATSLSCLLHSRNKSLRSQAFPLPSHCRILDPVTACNSHINTIWKSQKCGIFLLISYSKPTQTHHDLSRKVFRIFILHFTVFKVWNVINTLFTHDCVGFHLVCSYQRYDLPPDWKTTIEKICHQLTSLCPSLVSADCKSVW